MERARLPTQSDVGILDDDGPPREFALELRLERLRCQRLDRIHTHALDGIFFPADLKAKCVEFVQILWEVVISMETGMVVPIQNAARVWDDLKTRGEPLRSDIEREFQSRLQSHAKRSCRASGIQPTPGSATDLYSSQRMESPANPGRFKRTQSATLSRLSLQRPRGYRSGAAAQNTTFSPTHPAAII